MRPPFNKNILHVIECVLEAFIWIFVWEIVTAYKGPFRFVLYFSLAMTSAMLLTWYGDRLNRYSTS